jgi:hypothetical protein
MCGCLRNNGPDGRSAKKCEALKPSAKANVLQGKIKAKRNEWTVKSSACSRREVPLELHQVGDDESRKSAVKRPPEGEVAKVDERLTGRGRKRPDGSE